MQTSGRYAQRLAGASTVDNQPRAPRTAGAASEAWSRTGVRIDRSAAFTRLLSPAPFRSDPACISVTGTMGLFANRRVNSYLKDIDRAAWSAAQAQPKGSPESAFYFGVVSAARQRLGTEPRPTNRQTWLYSVLPSMAHGWVFATEQIVRNTEEWDPAFQFVLPLPPETKLYNRGRLRTSRTIWHDSVDDFDYALRLLGRASSKTGKRDEAVTRLNNAREGFAHLWPRMSWRDSTFGRSLVAQCQHVILTITIGDPARLQQEKDKAASLLATAKRCSPAWSWSVDNEY